jgi:hypothetical protein
LQLFDPKFNEYVIIDCNKDINNLSRIRVSAKVQKFFNNIESDSELKPNSKSIQKSLNCDELYAIKESKCYVSDPRLLKFKLDLKPESYNRFKHLLKVIKEFSNNDCNNIRDYDWIYLIPNRMSQIGYKNMDQNYWKNNFNNFMDLYIRVIH